MFQFRAVSVSPAASAAPARLASSQLRRIRRVVDAAIALAERGGFDAVKLRDVAEASGVALGTLYKYFRSKEEILLFAVNEDMERLEAVMKERPPRGETPTERVTEFFARATRGFEPVLDGGAAGRLPSAPLAHGGGRDSWRGRVGPARVG